jgi:Tfp pilus assembly protein PilV
MPGISCRQNLSLLQRVRDEMPSIPCRRNPSAPQSARGEAGFALIEVMVSAVLLIVLALATLSVIDKTQETSSNNRSRDVAAQIAQSEQDAIRQLPISALAGGYHPGDAIKPVAGISYTVSSSADWVTDSGGAVTCSTSGRVAYLKSTTAVTWPGMGSIKPVTADAIVDPGVAALGANKGALTVLLSRADGTGTSGIIVTAGGVSGETDDNGCAVLANLDAGPQTLTYNAAGYVDKDSNQSVSKAVTIGAGTIAQASGLYDVAGKINTTIVDDSTPTAQPADWPLPNTVAMDHAQRSTPTLFTIPIDATLSNASVAVFPFSSSYKAYVGSCAGNDPSNTLYTNGGAAPGAQVNPGQTKSVTLTMRRVTLNLAAVDVSNAVVIVAPDTTAPSMATGCGGTVKPPSLTVSGNSVSFPVPYGVWRVCAYKKVSSTSYPITKPAATSLWNTGGSPPPTDRPVVVTTPTTTGNYVPRLMTTLPAMSGGGSSPPTSC